MGLVVENPLKFEDGLYFLCKVLQLQSSLTIVDESSSYREWFSGKVYLQEWQAILWLVLHQAVIFRRLLVSSTALDKVTLFFDLLYKRKKRQLEWQRTFTSQTP